MFVARVEHIMRMYSIVADNLLLATDLESRGASSYKPVQVINLDVKDNHEEATLGAFLILELCDMVSCDVTE